MEFIENDGMLPPPDNVDPVVVAGAIEIYNNIFDENAAKKIIDIAEGADKNINCPVSFTEATVGESGAPGGSVRSNVVLEIVEHKDYNDNICSCGLGEASKFVRERLSLFVRYYSSKYDIPIAFDEGLQLLKYSPGRRYRAHIDDGPGVEHRVVSGLIYLNPTEYTGGGTYFTNFDYNIHPDVPSLALFPSNYAYRHEARPIFEGTKYAIVTWFGPPWARRKK